MNSTKKNNIVARLKKALIIYTITIIIITIVSVLLNKISESYSKNINSMNQDIDNKNNQLLDLQNKITEVKKGLKIWDVLYGKSVKHNGLEIDNFQAMLTNLQEYYQIDDKIDLSMTSPVEMQGLYKTNNTAVVYSTVNLKISAISDEILLQFIDSIIKNSPGFISLQSIEISKKSELTDTIILKASHGDFVNLTEAIATFIWKDFKDL